MALPLIAAALIDAGGQYLSSSAAANAQEEALATAGAQQRIGARQQSQATGQQLELARPLVQTRDAALGALQTLFGLPQTSPTQIAPTGSFGGTGGRSLIPLSGVTAKEQVQGGRDIRQGAFYDPNTGRVVDESGAVLGMVPTGGGTVAGLTSGKNNSVRVDAQGNVYSVGSSGENVIGTVPMGGQAGQVQGAPDGAQAGLPTDRNALLSTLMNTPGIKFVDDQGRRELEQMLAARGLRNSGRALEAGIQRASDLASTNYTNLVLNPLFQLAGFGQQGAGAAANALAQQGQNAAGNANSLSNLALQAGNARASSFAARGEAVGDLASNLAGIYARNGGFGGAQPKTGTTTAPKVGNWTPAPGDPRGGIYNDPFSNPYYGGN